MSAAGWVYGARRAAGVSQRELARKSGVAQSAVARIERGQQIPRTDTLERLLTACGFELQLGPVRGGGVDRDEIRRFLELTPRERAERGAAVGRLAEAYGIVDEGQTIGAVLRTVLDVTTGPAKVGSQT